jgi:meiotic recombination protein SPO11
VVEKDAIFQRLSEDRLADRLPMVLVTAKGMPDLATRAFLCR